MIWFYHITTMLLYEVEWIQAVGMLNTGLWKADAYTSFGVIFDTTQHLICTLENMAFVPSVHMSVWF